MGSEITITFRCPKEVSERLDKLAQKADMPRSRLILNIVDEISKTLELTGKVGILQFGLLIRDLMETHKKWIKKVKAKKVEPL